MLRQVDEEIEKRVQSLVHAGEIEEEEASHLLEKLLVRARKATRRMAPSQETVDKVLKGQGIPTQDDILHLTQQLDELSAKLERLHMQTETGEGDL
jgi:polyhydroxyalkanoate synthesis regulator phasin